MLGRFISPDTIVSDPFNPQSINRYSYVLNNPLNYIDPTGYWPEDGLTEEEFDSLTPDEFYEMFYHQINLVMMRFILGVSAGVRIQQAEAAVMTILLAIVSF